MRQDDAKAAASVARQYEKIVRPEAVGFRIDQDLIELALTQLHMELPGNPSDRFVRS